MAGRESRREDCDDIVGVSSYQQSEQGVRSSQRGYEECMEVVLLNLKRKHRVSGTILIMGLGNFREFLLWCFHQGFSIHLKVGEQGTGFRCVYLCTWGREFQCCKQLKKYPKSSFRVSSTFCFDSLDTYCLSAIHTSTN